MSFQVGSVEFRVQRMVQKTTGEREAESLAEVEISEIKGVFSVAI